MTWFVLGLSAGLIGRCVDVLLHRPRDPRVRVLEQKVDQLERDLDVVAYKLGLGVSLPVEEQQ